MRHTRALAVLLVAGVVPLGHAHAQCAQDASLRSRATQLATSSTAKARVCLIRPSRAAADDS